MGMNYLIRSEQLPVTNAFLEKYDFDALKNMDSKEFCDVLLKEHLFESAESINLTLLSILIESERQGYDIPIQYYEGDQTLVDMPEEESIADLCSHD